MQQKWWTLGAVLVGTFMLLLDLTIVVVALPEIQSALHASFGDVQWVIDAYALTLASLLLTTGVLADRYGRRRMFAIGLVVFTGGSLICGIATDPIMLIVSRSAQGVGGATMFATSLALLAQSFSGRERGIAFGAWGAVSGAAVACGPIFGGLITTEWNWRGIFLVNVPIGVVALAVTIWRVTESAAPRPARPDWAGFVLLTAGLITLVYGFIRAGESSWRSLSVLACLAVGVALLVSFVIVEARVSQPMFDLALFRIPTFVGGAASAFAMNASLFTMLLYLVLYLQDVLGYSALGTGLRLLLITGSTLVVASIAGRLSSVVPVRFLIGPGLGLVGLGLLEMSGLSATSTWTALIPGFLLGGVGAGMVNPPLASTAIGVVRPERSGMASGVNSTFRQVGIAISIAALGSLFGASLSRYVRANLAAEPGLRARSDEIAVSVRQGQFARQLSGIAPASRAAVTHAIRTSFAWAMNDLLVITASVAFVGAAAALILIRPRDFVESAAHHE